MENNTYSKIALAFVLLIFVLGVAALFVPEKKEVVIVPAEVEKPFLINPFDLITVEAEAVFVYDIVTGEILYSRNEEKQLALASITKLMTAVIAREYLQDNLIVSITRKAIMEEGDSGLMIGETWRLQDLIDFTLLTSSNDGAYAIATASESLSFIDKMNEKAHTIELTQTYFSNESGLDASHNNGGAYGSARDVALLVEYIIRNHVDLIESTRNPVVTINSHHATNTNKYTGDIPGLIGSKTGYTDLAGGNLVIAFDAGINRPIVISVLGSSYSERFRDVDKLAAASLKYIQKK